MSINTTWYAIFTNSLRDLFLGKDEVQPVKVRFVGVRRSIIIRVEGRRAAGAVVDVRRGEGDTLSVLDIEIGLQDDPTSISPYHITMAHVTYLNARITLVITTAIDFDSGK